MRKEYFLILLLVCPVLIRSQEKVREEVIKGKYTGKIEEKKPETELEYPLFEVVNPYGGRGSHIYDKELKERSEFAVTPLPGLESDQIRKPWLNKIITPPIAIFHPVYGRNVKKWELVITDATGKVVRTFSNKGRPPKNIRWDGRDKEGKMIDVGTDYSYYVKAVDQLGNTSQLMGRKIRLPGIFWKDELNSYLRLDGRIVFAENSPSLTKEGESLLLEASDIIRHDLNKRLKIAVYSRKEELSQSRVRVVAEFLMNRIILPEGVVSSVSGYKSLGEDETDRLDIIIR